ncbi:MAG: pyruvate formate lyase family protein [Pseudomonadales bacterium]|nr:pyruvate formate lyase family protein [Pseudomonadales bacterium]
MQAQAAVRQVEGSAFLDLDPDSRIYRLRDMYWQKTHLEGVGQKNVAGSREDTLVGHAKDFAALLDASDPFIQAEELIVGCRLTRVENRKALNLGYYDPHYPPGHALILRMGLPGIRDRAREKRQKETSPEKKQFLEAVEIAYQAACDYVVRFADFAAGMAAHQTSSDRRRELETTAGICRELTLGPPTSFQAALQLFQFTRVFGGVGCIGRFDQWMYPFYKQDIANGRLTREAGQELLECLFIKLNYFGDENWGVNNDVLRNISLAGQTADGKDACNELTHMCMEASAKLMLPEPKLNVRCFDGSPAELVRASCQVMARGANILAVFNDEVVLPALLRLGIPIEEARDYCNDGCSELIMGGKGTIAFRVHDSLPVLTETVLAAEDHPYKTFEDVMADFKERLAQFMPEDRQPNPPITSPFFAASIEDCLEEASPSAMRYSIAGSILAQVGDTADGLAAIKKFIFEDGTLTWSEFVKAIKADYKGYERLRQMLRNRAPKFGNGDDYVDRIAKDIAEYFCDGVHERAQNPPGPGNKRAAGLMCFGIHGKRNIGASPDGRRQGDLTANSFSPAVGMDKSGPTAVLNSTSKVDLTKASHGSVLDMALHSSTVADSESFEKFVTLVDTFLTLRGTATLQMNIINRDILERAREDPDNPEYRTLIVRVWGFSAVFVELPPDLQDHVMSRTQHGF